MKQKHERRELLTITLDGRNYTGNLIISGTRKLFLTVEYQGHKKTDSRTWGTNDEELHNLRVMADVNFLQLLRELKNDGHNPKA